MEITMDQPNYVGELTAAPIDPKLREAADSDKEGHRQFPGTVGSVLWAARMTRPYISLDVAVISGATNTPTVAEAQRAAKVVKKAKYSEAFQRFPGMSGPIFIIAYCDAAWGNLSDGKTGGGIVLAPAAINVHAFNHVFFPIGWIFKHLRRFLRSTFAGGTLIASDALDEVVHLPETQTELVAEDLGWLLRTEPCSLHEHAVFKGTCKERRHNGEINALKGTLQQGKITQLEWFKIRVQLADAMTKHMTALSLLPPLNFAILH